MDFRLVKTVSSTIKDWLCQALDGADESIQYNWYIAFFQSLYVSSHHITTFTFQNIPELIVCIRWQEQFFPNERGGKALFLSQLPTRFLQADVLDNLTQWMKNQPIEILGWLHQAYVLASNDASIISETQFFTPTWVAEYLVQNTLGMAYWAMEPATTLKNDWLYLLTLPTVYKPKNLSELTFFDPCCGSGQILLVAFRLFLQIYKVEYPDWQIEAYLQTIFEHHLFGVDIDQRVVELCQWSLWAMACETFTTVFIMKESWKLHVAAITALESFSNQFLSTIHEERWYRLLKYFPHQDVIGSLTDICEDIRNQLLADITVLALDSKCVQTALLPQTMMLNTYQIVVTNPPYLGKKGIPQVVKKYMNHTFSYGKSELYSAFMERNLKYVKKTGYLGMLTIHSWMFIQSFEGMRRYLLEHVSLQSLLHLGQGTFPMVNSYNALACAFVFHVEKPTNDTIFLRLVEAQDIEQKQLAFFNPINRFSCCTTRFLCLPKCPMVYWLSQQAEANLLTAMPLGKMTELRQGLATGNNQLFVRYWYEIPLINIGFSFASLAAFWESGKQYVPYNKGGKFRKWYGNSPFVIRFDQEAYGDLLQRGNHLPSRQYYFKPGITWSLFGFRNFSVKYKEPGYVFDVSGSSLFCESEQFPLILSFLSSKVAFYYLSILAPTVNFQVGNIKDLPYIVPKEHQAIITSLTQQCLLIMKEEDAMDIASWNFKVHPLCQIAENQQRPISLQQCFEEYHTYKIKQWLTLKQAEEQLNHLWIRLYQLQDILTDSVEDADISVKLVNIKQSVQELLDYAVGCILGRYPHQDCSTSVIWATDELDVALRKWLHHYFSDVTTTIHWIESVLHTSLKRYLTQGFQRFHQRLYHDLPIYWVFTNHEDTSFWIYCHHLNAAVFQAMVEKCQNEIFKEKLWQYKAVIVNLDWTKGIAENYGKLREICM